MSLGILGQKIGMTQIFTKEGNVVPVTVIEAGPCVVVQVKTMEKEKYSAIQIGYKDIKDRLIGKPLLGHFKKTNVTPKRFLKEIRIDRAEDLAKYQPGHELKVDLFSAGEQVDIAGISKGRGFTGVMKRYNFKGTRNSHGQGGEYHRHGGSIGQKTHPGRVFKGLKMPGHYGVEQITMQNLKVVQVDAEKNLILINGAVPGANGGIVFVSKAIKGKK